MQLTFSDEVANFSESILISCVHVRIHYRGADKSLARPTSRCILFDGENISFDGRIVVFVYIHK